jgi:hypothetical protein
MYLNSEYNASLYTNHVHGDCEYLKLYLKWIVTEIYASWNYVHKLIINFIILIFWSLAKGLWKTIAVEVLPESVREIPCFPMRL